MKQKEIRNYGYEVRAEKDSLKLSGYVNKWNDISECYQERIARGAFTKTLQEKERILVLYNHDISTAMATTENREGPGSLRLWEDETGLYFETELLDVSEARDCIKRVNGNVLNGMSFGFYPIKTRQVEVEGRSINEQLEVELIEISPVIFAAYPSTEVFNRAEEMGFDFSELLKGIETKNEEIIRRNISQLEGFLKVEEALKPIVNDTTTLGKLDNHSRERLDQLKQKILGKIL